MLGEGEWGVRGARGGVGFLIESPKGGGPPGREGPTGRKGVCSPSGDLEGGRLNIFFSGPKCPPSFEATNIPVTVAVFLSVLRGNYHPTGKKYMRILFMT